MEVIIEIPEQQAEQLDRLVADRRITRSEVIQAALDAYLKDYQIEKIQHDVFGFLSTRSDLVNGAAYQRQARLGWHTRKENG